MKASQISAKIRILQNHEAVILFVRAFNNLEVPGLNILADISDENHGGPYTRQNCKATLVDVLDTMVSEADSNSMGTRDDRTEADGILAWFSQQLS